MLRIDSVAALSRVTGPTTRRCRIALYSHDTMGIGHMRRNMLIAQALRNGSPDTTILLVAGAREAGVFPMPRGMDCLTVPSLRKELSGRYQSGRLNVELTELVTLRARIIEAALEEFAPDLLIVDKEPRGALGELNLVLPSLRARHGTRCVLGLRDILDEPAVVRREWRERANEQAIREFYDAIWVYGDPKVYDPVHEYAFSSDVAQKVRYSGYLDSRTRLRPSGDGLVDGFNGMASECGAAPRTRPDGQSSRYVLCAVGGGQDGAVLAEAFADAELGSGIDNVLITGPFMPADVQARLRRLERIKSSLIVHEFVTEPDCLIAGAESVIAMGGYNTVCEVLSYGKRALIVPRVRPRQEQWIRANRLQELGLIDVMNPEKVSPSALSNWAGTNPGCSPNPRKLLDFDGTVRLPGLLAEVLAEQHGCVAAGR